MTIAIACVFAGAALILWAGVLLAIVDWDRDTHPGRFMLLVLVAALLSLTARYFWRLP